MASRNQNFGPEFGASTVINFIECVVAARNGVIEPNASYYFAVSIKLFFFLSLFFNEHLACKKI